MADNLSILVVDDEESIRSILAEFLSEEYKDVSVAPSGRKAQQVLDESPVDIIITDMVMPDIGGLDLLKKVQENFRDTIVIVMTGYASVESAVEAMRLGAFDYLVKPFNLSEAQITVQRAVELLNLRKENARLIENLRGANEELKKHRRRLKEEVYQTNRLLQQRVVELSSLYEIGKSLVAELDLNRLIQQTVERVGSLLGANKISVMLYEKEAELLRMEVVCGLDTNRGQSKHVVLGAGPSGYCALTRQPLLVENVNQDPRFRGMGIPPYLGQSFLCVPLIAHNELVGVLNVAEKEDGQTFTQPELDFVVTLASQAAIAIDNATLYEHVQKAYFNTVQSLSGALEKKDQYTLGHSERVTKLCRILAETLGLPDGETQTLIHASTLHDIGKIGISESILCKPGALTDEEYKEIKQHPVMGEQILNPLDFLGEAMRIVRHHHEREDGMGYPDGLTSEDLSLPIRILIAADSFDAMTSARPYRSSLSLSQAISELDKCKGSQFHPDVSECFISVLEERADEIMSEGKTEKVRT